MVKVYLCLQCQEAGCERRFTTIYNLNSHMKLHVRPLTEKCQVCAEMFATRRALDVHMEQTHEESDKPYL